MPLSHAERNRLYRQRHPERIREQNRRTKERAHGAEWLEPRFKHVHILDGLLDQPKDTAQVIAELMQLRLVDRREPPGFVTRWVMYDADATWSLWLRDLAREDLIRLHGGVKVSVVWTERAVVRGQEAMVAQRLRTHRHVSLRWLRHRRLSITEMVRGRAYPMVIEDIGSWWQFKPLAEVLLAESCQSVDQLAQTLDARLRAVGVPVRQYFGPGPAAESMLRRFHARDEIHPAPANPPTTAASPEGPKHPDEMACLPETAASCPANATAQANFGGRIQLLQIGKFSKLYAYDLNSAYCWALSLCPSIKGREWVHTATKRQETLLHPFGVYRVRWSIPAQSYTGKHGICPFPQRYPDGSIGWLCSGEGWHHACEIQAVLDNWDVLAHGASGARLSVLEGWEPTSTAKTRPAFLWGRLAYAMRQSEPLLKVPLAALYGKLAETGGKFHSPYHAGWITARVRAEMIRSACLNAPAIVEIATDCIRSTEPLALAAGEELGNWKPSVETNCIHVQPGVSTCDQKRRQRGIEGDYIPWDEIGRQIGRRNQIDVVARAPTFIGIGEAIQFDRWEDFCTMQTIEYPIRVDAGLADPRGETFGGFRPDPAGPVAGVRRGLPWAREDVEAWI